MLHIEIYSQTLKQTRYLYNSSLILLLIILKYKFTQFFTHFLRKGGGVKAHKILRYGTSYATKYNKRKDYHAFLLSFSNGNTSETKANKSFDNGVFFDIEAK
jgi:hypothetical protein